ncbi:MAG: LCP family protein [Clostridia bacterium]|nr:LCP family protein [Clostridia bacterium]
MAKKEKNNKKGKKILIAVLCIFLAIVIALFAVGFSYWKKITQAPPPVEDTLVYDFDGETLPSELVDDPVFEQMYEGDAADYKTSVKNWVTNGGDVMYSKNVINVLCVGVDTRNANTISGLSDSMILVSVNTELGTITFTSIMRDCYAYLQSPSGDGSFNKINSAFPFYGIDNLIDTIEGHFKVRIDGYAMINFALFKAVIDKFDGVTVPVKEYEAAYINANYGFNIQSGSAVTLNGDEALAFCRSRKCDNDGDVSRTRRQRTVLLGLLNKATTIKASEVAGYVETMMPYLETSYSEAEVITLGTRAVVSGWADYRVFQLLMPDEASRTAHSGDIWYWEVDYPLAAQTLQLQIYGKTNITLNDDRGNNPEPSTEESTEATTRVTTTAAQ